MANNRIIIEAFKLEGFRAYLQEQVFNLVRNKIPHSLAIFAPNAKGKSSIVDAFEYYISEEATLNRLGKRAAQTKAGPIAMEHVEAQENGVDSSVHFWFKQGDDKFSDSRKVNVSLSTPPLTNAAKRILKYAKVPFIIRGFELRKFVDGVTPEKRYENIVKWFNLEPLFLIQKNLRQLRRQIKQKAEQNSELNERLIDLKHRTNNEIVTWDELKVCEWFNANVLFHLDKTLKLKTISESDETYQVLINRKEAEEKGIGLATLKQLISIID
ncbi:MAG: AAA family ATPase, partial [Candidatus Omnitrophica bacterium]|nr:AAA family ATPase [Candidatus Omnitrophota bacterium]